MKNSIVQSERQRPRAIDLMKDIYSSHITDCKLGEKCPTMIDLKKRIEEEERILNGGSNFNRSFGLK